MTVSEIQKQQQADLHARLWSIANTLRGTMEAYDFKNYILGLIFYRYLSENVEQRVAKLLEEDEIDRKRRGKMRSIVRRYRRS